MREPIKQTKRMERLIRAAYSRLSHDSPYEDPSDEAYEVAEWLRRDFDAILRGKEPHA